MQLATLISLLASMAAGVLARDGVHLVNCDSLSGPNLANSAVVFCDDDSNCNFYPSGNNICFVPEHNTHWEGSSQSCTFENTGVTFSWGLAADAQSHATYTPVGGANNGVQQFTCYKDDGHPMFTQNGVTCKSIYYCI